MQNVNAIIRLQHAIELTTKVTIFKPLDFQSRTFFNINVKGMKTKYHNFWLSKIGYHSLNRSHQPPGHENDYVCARAIREMSSKDYPITSAPNSIKVRRHNRKNYQPHIGI